MAYERIVLSALWVARMLTGLQGDVLRFLQPGLMDQIASGDVEGMALTDSLLFAASMLMLLPIAMVVLSLTLPYRVSRWANILLAAFFIAFDLVGLPSYGSAHGIALIAAGIAFNVATVWYAWTWRAPARSPRPV
ncbi:MAG: DUF6326 family protein [Deinococcales bacterium]